MSRTVHQSMRYPRLFTGSCPTTCSASTLCAGVARAAARNGERPGKRHSRHPESSWLSTVRGRAGYALDRFLVYGTGGAAFGNVRANLQRSRYQLNRSRLDSSCWFKVAFARNWSAKADIFSSISPTGHAQLIRNRRCKRRPVIPNVAVKFNGSIVRGINKNIPRRRTVLKVS